MTEMEKNIALIQVYMDSSHPFKDESDALENSMNKQEDHPSRYNAKRNGHVDNQGRYLGLGNKSTNKPDYDQTKAIEQFLQDGLKIQAIKKWRELTGDSLIDAKSIVEHFEKHGV